MHAEPTRLARYRFHTCRREERATASATIRVMPKWRPRRRPGARFRCGVPPPPRSLTRLATALTPEGPCWAKVRRCRVCPEEVVGGWLTGGRFRRRAGTRWAASAAAARAQPDRTTVIPLAQLRERRRVLNAVRETFHATLKKETIYRQSWPTRAEARAAIFSLIEGWYSPRRRHSTLAYLSPAEFERRHRELAQAALQAPLQPNGSVTDTPPRALDALTTRRISPVGVDLVPDGQV